MRAKSSGLMSRSLMFHTKQSRMRKGGFSAVSNSTRMGTREGVERALIKADYLNSTEIKTLQALANYVVSFHSCFLTRN